MWVAFWAGVFAIVLAAVLVAVLAPGGQDRVVAPHGDRALVKRVPVAWSAPTDEYDNEHPYESTLRQAWVADGAVVRAGIGALRSFDPAGGELNWETPIPKHVRVCGSSVGAGTIAALAYGTTGPDEHKQCDHVLVVDVHTGKATQDLAFDLRTEGDPMVDVLGSALYAGLPLQTAPDKPATPPPSYARSTNGPVRRSWRAGLDGCHPINDLMASETRVLVLATCRHGGFSNRETVFSMNPGSGAVEWSAVPPESGQLVFFAILSADPPVVAKHVTDFNCCVRQRYLVFDGDGRQRTTIERGDGSELAAGMSSHWFDRETISAFAVVGSTLITGTWPDGTGGLGDRQLAGFDLDTGDELRRTRLPDDAAPTIVEPVTPGRLSVFDTAGFRLFDLDANTGRTEQVATLANPFNFDYQFGIDFFPRATGNMLVLFPQPAEYATDAIAYRLSG